MHSSRSYIVEEIIDTEHKLAQLMAERKAMAKRMREAGLTFQHIGDKFQVSKQRAMAIINS